MITVSHGDLLRERLRMALAVQIVDEGIGPYECWGQRGYDVHLALEPSVDRVIVTLPDGIDLALDVLDPDGEFNRPTVVCDADDYPRECHVKLAFAHLIRLPTETRAVYDVEDYEVV